MRRVVPLLLVLLVVLSGCGGHAAADRSGKPCTPPGGGRCAQGSAWSGPIFLTHDGTRLHRVIICGGTPHASETATRVYLRLHLGAIGAGAMSCAKADVGVRLAAPLGDRTVVDSVGRHVMDVIHGPAPGLLIR